MRNLKKVLALVIAFSMMLSVVAFAGYNDVAADADYAGAVELLSALEIFEGDDQGNFNPDNTITRSEMAAIICRALGLEGAANGAMGATAFVDVAADHWASGYVNLASQNGIIAGYGDGRFGPEDTLTYEAAVAMIVRALGFEPMAAQKGGWSAGYLVVANGYKITAGAGATATRANVAILMANALTTPMMDQTTYGPNAEYQVLDGKNNRDYKTLLTGMDIYIATGVVGAKDVDTVDFEVKKESKDFEFKKNDTPDFVIADSNIADYKNQMVDAYVKELRNGKYEVLAVVPATIGETFTLLSDDIDDIVVDKAGDKEYEVAVKYFVDGSSKTKKIDIDLDSIEYNKADYENTLATLIGLKSTRVDDIELQFIENTGDDIYDVLVATKYESTRVDYVEADRDKIGYDNANITLDFEDEDKTIVLKDSEGKELSLADFEEDDVIAVVTDGNKITKYNYYIEIVKLANATVTGSVESTWEDDGVQYITIDGRDYQNDYDDLEPGQEGTFYIGLTGKIIDFEVSTVNNNYGFILEAAQVTDFTKTKWQVKMLTAADGVVILDVDDDADADLEAILTTINGWDDDTDVLSYVRKDVDNRLVEYEVNSKGLIDEVALATANGSLNEMAAKSEYNADSQRIDGKELADDIAIMYIDKAKSDDVYAADISYLVDEAQYDGYIFKDKENKENCVMIVTGGMSPFKAEAGFAIVTKVATGKDTATGETVTKISYVQAEEEGVLTFTDDSEVAAYTTEYDKLAVGSVFLFSADGEGVVNSYAIIGKYNGKDFEIADGVADDYVAEKYGEDAAIATGYLYYKPKKGSSAYIATSKTVDDVADLVEVSIASSAFQYTFDNSGRTTKIETANYLATDNTEFWTVAEDQTKATPVLYVTIDGEVVDIFSANDKVTVTFERIAELID